MIAFEVTLNGNRVCTAGIKEWGVLSAIVTWVRRQSEQGPDAGNVSEEIGLDVGGLDSTKGEHLKWILTALQVGDAITIRVVETVEVDTPQERRQDDPEANARGKRKYYEQLKREYGE